MVKFWFGNVGFTCEKVKRKYCFVGNNLSMYISVYRNVSVFVNNNVSYYGAFY